MGGRIAEQVRRALIAAAKTGTVVAAIDATGCEQTYLCGIECPPSPPAQCDQPEGGTGGAHGTGGHSNVDAGKDR